MDYQNSMMKFDEIRELLAEKFSKEKKRLKSYGTKTNSFDLANVVTRYVEALMAEARASELKKLNKKLDTFSVDDNKKIIKYINERIHATSAMAKAIRNEGIKNEAARPWKRKEHKHKHRR